MKKKDIIDKLKDDNNYYGDFGRRYLSNSDISVLLNSPKKFRKYEDAKETLAMVQGRYFHTAMLEPEKLDNFGIVDASTRNTKIYKESVNNGEILLLKKEVDNLNKMVDTMKSNKKIYEMIYNGCNQYEVPGITTLLDIEWKGKADIVSNDCLIDIKTTSSISDFKWSARKYNYDSQAYIYKQIFGKPMVFVVIDKSSMDMGIYRPTEEFLLGGREKVFNAVLVYNKFFSQNPTEDIEQYVHEGEL